MRNVVDRIKALCQAQGLTLNQLEKAINLKSTIARWDDHEPSIGKVQTVAQYFGVTVSDILGETPEVPPPETKKAPTPEGERQSDFADEVTQFLLTLPKDRLRGILLALGAPEALLSELDQQE